ncbi:MAG: hypothetical protein ACP5UH_03505 [Candidatus Micrarchaeia archaeon]
MFAAAFVALQYASSAQPNTSFGGELNATIAYINMVNKSAYIIFYPNLTSAYAYISEAKKAASSDPQNASALLGLAKASAEKQLMAVYKYRTESVIVLAVIAVILAIIIYIYMRPVQRASIKGK